MTNPDSFIDEVSSELRRDRLFARLRMLAPFAGLLVVVLVGGAAWLEWRNQVNAAEAAARGATLDAALTSEDPAERAGALAEVEAETAAPVVTMLEAAARMEAGESDAAAELLKTLPAGGGHPIWREIASFKALLIELPDLPRDEAQAALQGFAAPDASLRLLAEEQLALLALREGDVETAVTGYRSILADASATGGLDERAREALRALGASPIAADAEATE